MTRVFFLLLSIWFTSQGALAESQVKLSPMARTVRSLLFSSIPSVYFNGAGGRTSDPSQLTAAILKENGISVEAFREALAELKRADPKVAEWVTGGAGAQELTVKNLDWETTRTLNEHGLPANPATALVQSYKLFLESRKKFKESSISQMEKERRARDSTITSASSFSLELGDVKKWLRDGANPNVDLEKQQSGETEPDKEKPDKEKPYKEKPDEKALLGKSIDWRDSDVRKTLGRNEIRHEDDPDFTRDSRQEDLSLFGEWRAQQLRNIEEARIKGFRLGLEIRLAEFPDALWLVNPETGKRYLLSKSQITRLNFTVDNSDGKNRIVPLVEGGKWQIQSGEEELQPANLNPLAIRLDGNSKAAAHASLYALQQADETSDVLEKIIRAAKKSDRSELLTERLKREMLNHPGKASAASLNAQWEKEGLGGDFEKIISLGAVTPKRWSNRAKRYGWNIAAISLAQALDKNAAYRPRPGFVKFMAPFIAATGIFFAGLKESHEMGYFDPAYDGAIAVKDWTVETASYAWNGTVNGMSTAWNGSWDFLGSLFEAPSDRLAWLEPHLRNLPEQEVDWFKNWVKDLSPEDLEKWKQLLNKDTGKLAELGEWLQKIEPQKLDAYKTLFQELDKNLSPQTRNFSVFDPNEKGVEDTLRNALEQVPLSLRQEMQESVVKINPGSIKDLNGILSSIDARSLGEMRDRLKGFSEVRHQALYSALTPLAQDKLNEFQNEVKDVTADILQRWKNASVGSGGSIGSTGGTESAESSDVEGPPSRKEGSENGLKPTRLFTSDPITARVHKHGGLDAEMKDTLIYTGIKAGWSEGTPRMLFETDSGDLQSAKLKKLEKANQNSDFVSPYAQREERSTYAVKTELIKAVQNGYVGLPLPEGKVFQSVEPVDKKGQPLTEGVDFELLQTPRGIPVLKMKKQGVTGVHFTAHYNDVKGSSEFSIFLEPEILKHVVAKLREAHFSGLAGSMQTLVDEALAQDRFILFDEISEMVAKTTLYTYHPAGQLRADVPDSNEFKFLTGMMNPEGEFCAQCTGSTKMLETIKQIHSQYRPDGFLFASVGGFKGVGGKFTSPGHAVFAAIDPDTFRMDTWDGTGRKKDLRAPDPQAFDEIARKQLALALKKPKARRVSKAVPTVVLPAESKAASAVPEWAGINENAVPEAPELSRPLETPEAVADASPQRAEPPAPVRPAEVAAPASMLSKSPQLPFPFLSMKSEIPLWRESTSSGLSAAKLERRLFRTFAMLERQAPLAPQRGLPAAGAPPDPDTHEKSETRETKEVDKVAQSPEVIMTQEKIEEISESDPIRKLADAIAAIEKHPWFDAFRKEHLADKSLPTSKALKVAGALKAYRRTGDLVALANVLEPMLPKDRRFSIGRPDHVSRALEEIRDDVKATRDRAAARVLDRKQKNHVPSQVDDGFVSLAIGIFNIGIENDFSRPGMHLKAPAADDCAAAMARMGED